MRPDEETQDLPVAEARGGTNDDVEPPADLGPWGAEAVRLDVDAESVRRKASTGADRPRSTPHRWTTTGVLGLAVLLIGALVVTALPANDDPTGPHRAPAKERSVASAPRAAPPEFPPHRVERDRDKAARAPAKTRKRHTHTRPAPAPSPQPSPTYLPAPAPPPPSEPVTPGPAPALAAAEPSPAAQAPAATGASVAEEFGFEQ